MLNNRLREMRFTELLSDNKTEFARMLELDYR